MCIWNCKVEDRHCELCLYSGKCERQVEVPLESDAMTDMCVRVTNSIIGSDIRTESRMTLVRWGRYFVMYKLKKDGYSANQIGRALNRDHATVLHGVKCAYLAMDNPKLYPDVMPIWNSFAEKLSLQKSITV